MIVNMKEPTDSCLYSVQLDILTVWYFRYPYIWINVYLHNFIRDFVIDYFILLYIYYNNKFHTKRSKFDNTHKKNYVEIANITH